MKTREEMLALAEQARARAYAPYSHFAVGAALEGESGEIYLGCNIENAAYPVCICAERTALFAAVAKGERRFAQLAVVGGPEGAAPEKLCAPCGVCRQALAEFCSAEHFPVHLGARDGQRKTLTLGQLLPEGFGAANL